MPRNKRWTNDENNILLGVLNAHGSPRSIDLAGWPEAVRNQVKEVMVGRSDSGIYQQALKLLRARNETTPTAQEQGFELTTGA